MEPVGVLETEKSLPTRGACRTRKSLKDFLPMKNKKCQMNIRSEIQTLQRPKKGERLPVDQLFYRRQEL